MHGLRRALRLHASTPCSRGFRPIHHVVFRAPAWLRLSTIVFLAGAATPRLLAVSGITYTNGQDRTSSGTISAGNLTLTLGSGSATQSGVFSGVGGIAKTGAGTLSLTATNAFSWTTLVNAGTLLVNGPLQAACVVTVNSGGTLGGSGTIGGATTVASGGTLAPGNSPGLLTFSSSLTLSSGSNLTFEINGTGRGPTYDTVNATGLTTLGGTLSLVFGSTIANGTTLDLYGLTSGSSGNFDFLTSSGGYFGNFTNDGGIWTLTSGAQRLTFTSSTGDLAFSASAIPEPSSYAALAGLTALGLAALRRRRLNHLVAERLTNHRSR